MDIPTPFGDAFLPGWANQHPFLYLVFIQWPIGLAPALFTWFLTALLGYRRGQMAWIGAAISLILTVVLPLQLRAEPIAMWYPKVHVWLYGIFYGYALAGLALCAVGIYDRKRSAIWALLAMLSLVVAALHDTLIWFNLFSARPWVPYGFGAYLLLLSVGFIRRRADPPPPADLRESSRILANNRTRRSRSIVRKLLREGNLHWLPVYALVMQSDLGREGIINSGSYRFADHIYRNQPSGRGPFGRWIDALFLAMPATQAFHRRYKRCQDELRKVTTKIPAPAPIRVLAIPCGIPRDIAEFCEGLDGEGANLKSRIHYYGMDLDPALLTIAEKWVAPLGLGKFEFIRGNALSAEEYPNGTFDFVVSTGLGEFLKAAEIEIFYRNVHRVLAPGGVFYTSATRYEKRGESFLKTFELLTQYRTIDYLAALLDKLPWQNLKLVQDETGLQTYIHAMK
jgi:SAM-dependent methyltransferase